MIVRFLVSSDEVFAMYKMVVRFLCGLLEDRAACLIPIICHNLTTDTMLLIEVSMLYQLYYLANLVDVSDWLEFIKYYLFISTVIIETNSTNSKVSPLPKKPVTRECILLFQRFCVAKRMALLSLFSGNYIGTWMIHTQYCHICSTTAN